MADVPKKLTRRLVKLSVALLPGSAGVAAGHRLRAGDERRRARRADALVLSHAKSGRTWLRVMLSHLFQRRYGLPENELMEFDAWHRRHPSIPRILYTHGHYLGELFDAPPAGFDARRPAVVFLARHPCDIAVSQYFHFAKRTKGYKKTLHGVSERESSSMFDFVMKSELGLPEIIAYLNAWERRLSPLENTLFVRYEDLRARPEENLARTCAFLRLDFRAEEIEAAVSFAAFENLKELERQRFFASSRLAPADPADPDSYKVRRAKVGGYRDYFDAEQVAQMDEFVRKELSPFLGYGDSPRPA